jgi:hypothetical protein
MTMIEAHTPQRSATPSSAATAIWPNTSALSYGGVTRRTAGWVRHSSGSTTSSIAMWLLAIPFLAAVYGVLVAWYGVTFLLVALHLQHNRTNSKQHGSRNWPDAFRPREVGY